MPTYTLLEAPSILGLRPSGVQLLPAALQRVGLQTMLRAGHAGCVEAPPFRAERDPETHMLNPEGIREYSLRLSEALDPLLSRGEFPVVLGGDCSILLGSMLSLRRRGRYGLLFLDGHMDFYSPLASPTGEAADMDLALVTGRGPPAVCDIDGLNPYVRDEDTFVLGYRDAEDVERDGGASFTGTRIRSLPLNEVRRFGVRAAANAALKALAREDLSGFWIHLDVDVLDGELMPAVDYQMTGGLTFDELTLVLQCAIASGRAVGLEVTIFNPNFDPDGSVAERLVSCLVAGLRGA